MSRAGHHELYPQREQNTLPLLHVSCCYPSARQRSIRRSGRLNFRRYAERPRCSFVRRLALQYISSMNAGRYKDEAASFWNQFYADNLTSAYRDRNWLLREFPELGAQGVSVLEASPDLPYSEPTHLVS